MYTQTSAKNRALAINEMFIGFSIVALALLFGLHKLTEHKEARMAAAKAAQEEKQAWNQVRLYDTAADVAASGVAMGAFRIHGRAASASQDLPDGWTLCDETEIKEYVLRIYSECKERRFIVAPDVPLFMLKDQPTAIVSSDLKGITQPTDIATTAYFPSGDGAHVVDHPVIIWYPNLAILIRKDSERKKITKDGE